MNGDGSTGGYYSCIKMHVMVDNIMKTIDNNVNTHNVLLSVIVRRYLKRTNHNDGLKMTAL